jgi:hypothetical protein
MIEVTVTCAGQSSTSHFPNTVKGDRESVKYIQGLYNNRKDDPWYYLLDKIEPRANKLRHDGWKLSRTKKIQLEAELEGLEKERAEYLDMQGVTETPPIIKVEITNI